MSAQQELVDKMSQFRALLNHREVISSRDPAVRYDPHLQAIAKDVLAYAVAVLPTLESYAVVVGNDGVDAQSGDLLWETNLAEAGAHNKERAAALYASLSSRYGPAVDTPSGLLRVEVFPSGGVPDEGYCGVVLVLDGEATLLETPLQDCTVEKAKARAMALAARYGGRCLYARLIPLD